MKVKLDENLPASLAELLRSHGHDVATVRDENLSGASDVRLVKASAAERRVLLTYDREFADVRRYPPGTHAGIVVFRLPDQSWGALRGPARRLMEPGVLDRVGRGLAVVDAARVRFRRAPSGGRAGT